MPRDNSDLDPLFYEAGQKYGLNPFFLKSVAMAESGMNRDTPDSYQGAQGIMQIIPPTARALGVSDARDPVQAIPAAAKYLAEGYDNTGSAAGAVMYYHGGPDQRQWGPKTMAYVDKVAGHYTNMKNQPDPYADIIKKYTGGTDTKSDTSGPSDAGAPSEDEIQALVQKYAPPSASKAVATPDPDEGIASIRRDVENQFYGKPREGLDISKPETTAETLKNRASQVGGYVAGQLGQVVPQIATNAGQAYDMAKAGIADIQAGNLAPSLPAGALDLKPGQPTGGFGITPYAPPQPDSPSGFKPGGVLGTVAGALGIPGSIISGPAHTLIGEPVTQATGNPEIGQRAEAVGNLLLGNKVTNALTSRVPGAADPETLRLAQAADAWGIPIRNSQISNSPLVRKTDQMVGIIPGSGQASQRSAQVGAFTKAVSNTFGEDTPQITRTTLDQASKRIGGVMNDIEGRTTVKVDDPLINTLAKIDSDARQTFTPENTQYKQIGAQIDDIVNRAAANGGSLPGSVYKSLIQRNSPLDSLANSSDGAIATRAGQIKSALQDAMERSAAPEDAAAYSRARFQYKNMKTIEPLVTKGTPGEISPALLRGRVDANFDPRRAGPLGDLADIGQRFMRAPPDSGTPWGELVLNKLTSAPALLAGAAVGGVGGHFAGFNPMELAQGAAAAGAGALTARGVSSALNNPLYRAWLLRHAPGTGNELVNLP